MKKYLEKLLAKRKTELKETQIRFDACTDVTEVRALGETLASLRDEINDIEAELAKADDNGNGGNGDGEGEGRSAEPSTEPAGAPVVRNAGIVASYSQNAPQTRDNGSVLDSIEYRNAFASYVRSGDTSGFGALEQRAASEGMIITTDVGKLIPNTIMNEVIKQLKVYGNLYNKVRKLNVKGGVEFPIQDLVPTVTWISETTPSDNQSVPEVKASVSFGYHLVEARLAQSLLSSIVTLDYLESEIANLLVEAFVKEFDNVILNGSGSGQPLGILKDSRVANKIKFTAEELADWTKFRTKLFAKIPLAYRGQGIIVTTVATWESYFMTLKDNNNRPLYSEVFNVEDGTTTCRFAGREVLLVEPDIIKDFDTAASGEAFAVYFRPTDYAINSQMQIGFKRYYNEDTNKWVNKGLTIMDGKLLDTNGVFVLTK